MKTRKLDETITIAILWSRDARRALATFSGPNPTAQTEAIATSSTRLASAPTEISASKTENSGIMNSDISNFEIGRAPQSSDFTLRVLNAMTRRAVRAVVSSVWSDENGASSTRYLRRDVPCEVVVSFVSDAEIHAMNADYRHKNKPTDVLSFAQDEGEAFPVFSALEENSETSQTPPQTLGDVVISVETAWRQAQERAHSLPHEIGFLCVHGTLHLLGFDHIAARDRRVMWKQQDAVIEKMAREKRRN